MAAALRRGLVWVSRQTLMVQPNATPNAASPLLQRGPGYRLPTASRFQPLAVGRRNAGPPPPATADEMVAAVEYFHEHGAHPAAICFGGGHSEPFSSFPHVLDAMRAVRARRHGTPLVLVTNGLPNAGAGGDPVQDLLDLHAAWRDAPGSDGDPKLSVWVNVAAGNPPAYDRVMQPDASVKMGFQQVCGTVARLAEGGVRVVGTGSAHPAASAGGGGGLKQVEAMCRGMGCSDFFERSYHPETLYDVLGVAMPGEEDDAAAEAGFADAVAAAYRAKAKALHPDVNRGDDAAAATRAMAAVTEAHAVLGDPALRALYDSGVADLTLNDNEEDVFSSVVNKSY